MLTKESGILYCFAKAPWKKYTFSDLKKETKKKSKSYLALTIKRFLKEDIILQELIGKLPVYSLNIHSAKARAFAGFVLEHNGWRSKHVPYTDLEKVLQKIPAKGFVFLIAGSYAKNSQTKESDIDAVIIVDDALNTKGIYALLAHTCEMNIPPIHLYVFKSKEFKGMLLSKEANYGKEIAAHSLILYGGQMYIALLAEAMDRGFSGKHIY